ncbi:EbsA family protein [Carnobacterium divergens]|uniref:EbsA family protein n=1 Tax=Carnobacterium divergens TaxID=2748 RepID=A0AAW8RFQ9_CARDV|nr:EbsA family protein [Carnobacterium divergens]MDO0873840.1 EbsA family protein [Carnobacterium divergens]MDT1959125.1 EbsA family protein [Carnobacterium divergens]MDT1975013.1 EbsA family protein [Carnobacterium divergens]SUX19497.1 Uncharacterised protein [Carnobacterium divergens]
MKNEATIRYRLSLEPAYQIIYWSISWTTFFISLIGILEIQRVNVVSILAAIIFILTAYIGLGSYLTINHTNMEFSYLRGMKKESIPLESIKKIKGHHLSQQIDFKTERPKFWFYFFNKKIKTQFYQHFVTDYPAIPLSEEFIKTPTYMDTSVFQNDQRD